MTPFQKQVLLLEEKRQQEEAEQEHGQGASPSGTLNASRGGYTEKISYKNEQSHETENQATFVE